MDITLDDARTLIGEKGATLAMFQHLVRRVWIRQISRGETKKLDTADPLMPRDESLGFLGTREYSEERPLVIDVDINNYKRMREDLLKDFAIDIAETVREKKKTIELDPMSSFDRRIIHLALSNFSDVTTESTGEGERRYIVVRPHP